MNAEVARILREERERRGLSVNVLSQRAGLSRTMISYVEREDRHPTLDTLVRITEALEIDIAEVIRRAARVARDA